MYVCICIYIDVWTPRHFGTVVTNFLTFSDETDRQFFFVRLTDIFETSFTSLSSSMFVVPYHVESESLKTPTETSA